MLSTANGVVSELGVLFTMAAVVSLFFVNLKSLGGGQVQDIDRQFRKWYTKSYHIFHLRNDFRSIL